MLIILLRITLVVGVSFCFSVSTATEETENFIISVIQHLAGGETGVPECVFLGMPREFPFDGILERVIASPKLDHVSKHVIAAGGKPVNKSLLPDKPLLMVMNVGGFFSAGTSGKEMFVPMAVLESADPTTKLLVLVDMRTEDFRRAAIFCKYFNFIDVVYLDAVNRRVLRGNSISIVKVHFLPNPENLFIARSQKIAKRDMTISAPLTTSSKDPEIRWVLETARFLNIQVNVVRTMFDENLDLNLIHGRLNVLEKRSTKAFRMLIPAFLEPFVVLVPQHRVDIFQLFAMPFTWELWLAIIVIFFVSECLKFFLPAVLKNDPILLAVCGFEKHDLHKASRFEKMLMLSLIVLVFFSTCAYETRIISMMVSRPVERHINTVEELVQSGIKIRIPDKSSLTYQIEDTRITDMFVVKEYSSRELNGVNAFVMTREWAEFIATLSYDENLRHANYSVLEEPLLMHIRIYCFSERNPMLRVFEYTYQVFVESGIMDYWQWFYYDEKTKTVNSRFNRIKSQEDATLLIPAWIAFYYY